MKIPNTGVIVTGGANGIGFEVARLLHKREAQVIILDKNEDALNKLPNDFIKAPIDLTNSEDLNKNIDKLIAQLDNFSILINNAGKIYSEPFVNISRSSNRIHDFEAFKDVIEANLYTTFLLSRLVADFWLKNRIKGVFINMCSIASEGNAGQTAYAAAKGGIEAMTKTWAKELGPFGIRTNAISPGFIDTKATRNALKENELTQLKKITPLRKIGEPFDIASAVVFIIENEFINGAVIKIDGGLRI